MNQIHTEVVQITPALAKEWLKRNTANRAVSERKVNEYAKDMKTEHWQLNGETIIFGDDGRLVNGQHRLHACIKADASFPCVVVRNVDSNTFETIDSGKARTAADVLDIAGIKNYSIVASAARVVIEILAEGRVAPRNSDVLDFVQKNPRIQHWAQKYSAIKPAILPSRVAGVCYLIEKYHGEELASTFFEKAVLGIGLQSKDPELILRERVISVRRGQSIGSHTMICFYIKAANARILGKPISVLKMLENEKKPDFITQPQREIELV